MKRALSPILTVALSVAAMSLTLSCADKQPTAITVAISSEAKVPEGVKYVEISVRRRGEIKLQNRYEVMTDRNIHLPGTLAVVEQDDDEGDSSAPIEVKVEAGIVTGAGLDKKVIRSATLGFSSEKQKLLRMPIRFSCVDVDCPSGDTCKAGRCESDRVNVDELDDFVVDEVIPVAGTCFSRETCLGVGEEVVIPIEQVVDALHEDCTLPYVYATDGALQDVHDVSDPTLAALRDNINMGFLWSGEYDISNEHVSAAQLPAWTVVDNDTEEGWQFADVYQRAKQPTLSGDLSQQIVLAAGLCDALKADKAAIVSARAAGKPSDYVRPQTALLGVVELRGCVPKTPHQPECAAGQQGTTGK